MRYDDGPSSRDELDLFCENLRPKSPKACTIVGVREQGEEGEEDAR